MTRQFLAPIALFFSVCLSLTAPVQAKDTRLLVMGDSLMTWNGLTGRSVGRFLRKEFGDVRVAAVSGSMMRSVGDEDRRIPAQFRDQSWDWVVANGGGNDLLFGCGCGECDDVLDELVSADGKTGIIPDLAREVTDTGAKLLWVGYLRSPGVDGVIENCRDEGDALEARIGKAASGIDGMHFLSNAELVPSGDRSFHDPLMFHPSAKGSTAIAMRAAEAIRKNN